MLEDFQVKCSNESLKKKLFEGKEDRESTKSISCFPKQSLLGKKFKKVGSYPLLYYIALKENV